MRWWLSSFWGFEELLWSTFPVKTTVSRGECDVQVEAAQSNNDPRSQTTEAGKWFSICFPILSSRRLQHSLAFIFCLSVPSPETFWSNVPPADDSFSGISEVCLIKPCSFTPYVSVYLAAEPPCDQAAANLLQKEKKINKKSSLFDVLAWEV